MPKKPPMQIEITQEEFDALQADLKQTSIICYCGQMRLKTENYKLVCYLQETGIDARVGQSFCKKCDRVEPRRRK